MQGHTAWYSFKIGIVFPGVLALWKFKKKYSNLNECNQGQYKALG